MHSRDFDRHFLVSLLMSLAFAGLGSSASLAFEDRSGPSPADRVLDRHLSLSLSKVAVFDVIRNIHHQAHAPVSFIAAPEAPLVSIELSNGRVGDVLDEIVGQVPTYKVVVVDDRVILRPRASEYDAPVRGIELKNIPRPEAALRYAKALSRQVPSLGRVLGPEIFGSSDHPLYSETVSLTPEASVTEHLVQLLGRNPAVVFLLVPAKSGVPRLLIEYVE